MAKPIKARVLVNVMIAGILYQCGKHVVEIDRDLAEPYIKDGSLDPSTGAVKYALSDEGGAVLVVHPADAPPIKPPADPLVVEIEALAAAVAAETDPDKAAALQAQLDTKRAEAANLAAA